MSPSSLPVLSAAFRSGALSPVDYLNEIEEQYRTREPSILAFLPEVDRFGRVRREAAELLRRYPVPADRPPLFGVPVGVKDIFHVNGFITRAGSQLPAELLQGAEAESVTQLKAAGALILGKTVTTEFAYFGPGPTRNPRNTEHTPGGSSSGSAAAVGAGLCPLALGTQTIGSIIRPASFCGIVGFKPTYGRISTAGVIPLAASFDHVGFFAADVAGARLAASVLCRAWQSVPAQPRQPVLGIPVGPYLNRAAAEMLDHFRRTCAKLARAGYALKPVSAMADFDAIYERHYLIANGEAARVHRDWFPRFRDRYHAKTVEKLQLGGAVSEAELARARSERDRFGDALARLMDAQSVDLWISPSAIGPAPRGLESTGDPVMNLPWSHARMPTVGLPSGQTPERLPLGVQLTARCGEDERLLNWARELEVALAADD